MSDTARELLLRFEIQHIFPSEIRTQDSVAADRARGLLASIGFNFESRCNKMALFSSPEMRDAMRNAPPAVQQALVNALACGIDDAFVSALVERFYGTVRQDDMLGPIFAAQITDWPTHLARMKDFWASIMLDPGRFSGNPMRKHIAIGGLEGAHFERWWLLWEQTLGQIATGSPAAERFREAARRIGESLLTGIRIEQGGLAAISVRAAL